MANPGHSLSWAGFRLRLRRPVCRAFPFVVWGAALVGCLFLWQGRGASGPVQALAEASRYVLNAPVEGVLQDLRVSTGDWVEAGEVVARTDDRLLRLRLTRARHGLNRLQAELEGEKATMAAQEKADRLDLHLGRSRQINRLAREIEQARLDRLETYADLEETRIRHQGAADEVQRLGKLAGKGIVSDADLVRARTREEALKKRVEELTSILTARKARIAAIQEREESFTRTTEVELSQAPSRLEPLQWQIREQEVEFEEISQALKACALVAPGSGIVTEVMRRQGEYVREGMVILTIVEPRVRSVIAYLPQELKHLADPGQPVTFELPRSSGVYQPTRIQSVTPELVRMPKRLWRDPRTEEWAIAVRLDPLGDEFPGQILEINLCAMRRSTSTEKRTTCPIKKKEE